MFVQTTNGVTRGLNQEGKLIWKRLAGPLQSLR